MYCNRLRSMLRYKIASLGHEFLTFSKRNVKADARIPGFNLKTEDLRVPGNIRFYTNFGHRKERDGPSVFIVIALTGFLIHLFVDWKYINSLLKRCLSSKTVEAEGIKIDSSEVMENEESGKKKKKKEKIGFRDRKEICLNEELPDNMGPTFIPPTQKSV